MMLATNATIASVFQAFESGIVINLSGGFHHAAFDRGEGFCVFPDIPIAVSEICKKRMPENCDCRL